MVSCQPGPRSTSVLCRDLGLAQPCIQESDLKHFQLLMYWWNMPMFYPWDNLCSTYACKLVWNNPCYLNYYVTTYFWATCISPCLSVFCASCLFPCTTTSFSRCKEPVCWIVCLRYLNTTVHGCAMLAISIHTVDFSTARSLRFMYFSHSMSCH